MSNGFPYWQFHCDRWLSGKISAFDLEGQGLYLQFCMAAWVARGVFDICSTHVQLRFNKSKAWVSEHVESMVDLGILVKDGEKYRIKFIDDQIAELEGIRVKRSMAGKASVAARTSDTYKKEDQRIPEKRREEKGVEKCSTPVQHELNTCSIEKKRLSTITDYSQIMDPANDPVEVAALITHEHEPRAMGYWRTSIPLIGGDAMFRSMLSTLWGELKSGERPNNPAAVLTSRVKKLRIERAKP